MTEYAEVATSDYLSNLEKWHRDTSWICYGKRRSFSVYEIAACAYGNEEGSVLKPGEKNKKKMFISDLFRISYAAEEYRRI